MLALACVGIVDENGMERKEKIKGEKSQLKSSSYSVIMMLFKYMQ